MRVLVVGSGPTGIILGAALGRRGHDVVSVDRDPGPSARRLAATRRHAVRPRPQLPPPGHPAPEPRVAHGVRRLEAAGRGADRPRPGRHRPRPGGHALAPGDARARPAERGRRGAPPRAARRARRRPGPHLGARHRRRRGRSRPRRRPRRRRLRSRRTDRLACPRSPGPRPARRRVRPGVRRPHLPPPGGCRARPDEHPAGVHRRAARLPAAWSSSTSSATSPSS